MNSSSKESFKQEEKTTTIHLPFIIVSSCSNNKDNILRLSSKIGFKTLRKEEGGTTIGSATNGGTAPRIFILKSKLRYSISEPLQGEVPFGGLKTPNPRRKVKSVVIHIYSLALHELFFPSTHLLFCISITLENKNKKFIAS
jgi:hypothetical protein